MRMPASMTRPPRPAVRRHGRRCWSTSTATASTGATARWPTRCSCGTARRSRRGWSTPRRPSSTRRSATASAQLDLEIMTENVAGGLLDVAARREELPSDVHARIIDEAHSVADRYERDVGLLHDEPVVGLGDRRDDRPGLRDLNDLGFAVDEVRLDARPVTTGVGDDLPAQGRRRPAGGSTPSSCGPSPGSTWARARPDPAERPPRPPGRLRARASGEPSPRRSPPGEWVLDVFTPASSGPTPPSATAATPCRPTATCSRCGGC